MTQADLFGVEPAAVVESPAPGVWGAHRLVEDDADDFLVSWGAYRFDRAAGERQLARWLSSSTAYRALRCVLCRRALVVSLQEWRSERAQVVKCAYAGCGGWVQRDSEKIEPEEVWIAAERTTPGGGVMSAEAARTVASATAAEVAGPVECPNCGRLVWVPGPGTPEPKAGEIVWWCGCADEPEDPPDPLYDC